MALKGRVSPNRRDVVRGSGLPTRPHNEEVTAMGAGAPATSQVALPAQGATIRQFDVACA
jgi:hypothetical protein